MTEQEHAAALKLAKKIKRTKLHWALDGVRLVEFSAEDVELANTALRAYARPAPTDLREAATNAAYDATRLEDGTPQFAAAGFCLGHAAKMADAILALLPQTQGASDVLTDAALMETTHAD